MVMMSDGDVLTGLHFVDSRKVANGCRDCAERDMPAFREARRWLDEYFSGREPGFAPPSHSRSRGAEGPGRLTKLLKIDRSLNR